MSETMRTGIFAAIAAVSLVAALVARPAAPEREAFDDSGERFFEQFDPLEARSLEIVTFDEDNASIAAFQVAKEGDAWVIPSNENYPADAEEQLGQAAASVVDLIKGPKVSDRAADHELFEVVDPVTQADAGAGLGTRVTMKNAAGTVLMDLIIGRKGKQIPGQRYVRLPDRDRVYATVVDTTHLSTRFEDWIEADLLRLDPEDIRSIIINDYEVDEIRGAIVQGDMVKLAFDPDGSTWSLEDLAAGESLDETVVNGMKRALDDLKIVDVHRKPEGLSGELRTEEALRLDQAAISSLQSRGFYVAQGTLVSNQGETVVKMKDGVTYVLRFGEIALGERTGDAFGEEDGEEGAEMPAEAEGSARYLFIMAQFDPTLVSEPTYEELPALPTGEGDDAPTAEEVANVQAFRDRVATENDERREDHEAALEAGRERVNELNERFADWYYVISNDVYRKVRLTRDDLVTGPAADGTTEDAG